METTPPHVRSDRRERLRDGLEPAALPVRIADRELHPEPLAAGGPLLRPVVRARTAGRPRPRAGSPPSGPPKSRSYDDVGRHGPALVIHRDDRVADAGQDRAQPVVLLLGLALLVLDGDRLEPQLLGPGGEVLVGDAQLLDGRRQLLVERLELLVRGLELLVEGLDLLAAGLRVLARPEQGLLASRRSAINATARRSPAAGGRSAPPPCPAAAGSARARARSRSSRVTSVSSMTTAVTCPAVVRSGRTVVWT